MPVQLSSTHPQYDDQKPDWKKMRHCYQGQRVVKLQGTEYLPATASHIQDGFPRMETLGYQNYQAYKLRARFPNFVREAIQMAIGMMHSQPPQIKLPKAMEKIRSAKGETLAALLRRINTEQLITGRVGIMADLPTKVGFEGDTPYLTTYTAERMINWDDGSSEEAVPQTLNLMVLDESENVRTPTFSWTQKEKYRVLVLGAMGPNETEGVYRQGVFEGTFSEDSMKTPSWRGQTLQKIPFAVVNSGDVVSDVDEPPLLDLAELCMTLYRADADYRQNLFMQGQDTFVTIGANLDEDDKLRTGAGARVDLPEGGDAKYVGVQSNGLREQREDIDRMEGRAGSMGAQTLDTTSRERESGDSLRIRVAARTADMNQIVESGAAGLEHVLKTCAEWMGEDPEEVSVIPNKEFGEMPLTGQTMVEIATARNLGYPISARSMHDLAFKRRMTSMTFEEEKAAAESEKDSIFAPAENGDRNEENNPDNNQRKSDDGVGEE